MHEKDRLVRFLFEHSHVRGELVHLAATWQAAKERHDYPPVVQSLLGEAIAATLLLGATVKFSGSLILQIQGAGPMTLLVVQTKTDGTLRATANWNEDELLDQENMNLADLFHEGRLAITIEPETTGERYQGIVELGDAGIAEAIEGYFRQSEQLETQIWLAADDNIAAGLLVQQMPGGDREDENDLWNRVVQLSSTITRKELLEVPISQLIHRLYHEEDVRVFEPELISYRCGCSRDAIASMLRGLGYDEVQSILDEQEKVDVACEYCKQQYLFDSVDVEQIFAADVSPSVSKTRH